MRPWLIRQGLSAGYAFLRAPGPFAASLALVLIAFAVLLPGVGEATGLTGKDEFFLGLRTPMEMMERGGWMPFLDGEPRIKKPPLLYWLGRADFELWGASLLAARALSVAFAALAAVATSGIARRLGLAPAAAFLAGGILLSCLGLHTEGRRFMLDVPVAALSASAFWSFLIWRDERRWPWLSVSAVLLAAAVLVKGPVALGVCGSGGLALWACRLVGRPSSPWPVFPVLANAVLFLALALPWFVVLPLFYPQAVQSALADEMASRQFFQLSPVPVLGFFNIALPWAFVFLAAAWAARRERGLPRFLLGWFLLTLLPFGFFRSFDRYLVGSLIPAAIFLAAVLPGFRNPWPFRLGLAAALLLGGALAFFTLWFGLGGGYALCLPAVYFIWAWWRPRAPAHLAAAPMLYWLALLWGVFPALGVNAVPEAVLELGRHRAIAFFNGPQPALLPILSGRAHRHYARIEPQDAAGLYASRALVFAEAEEAPHLMEQLRAAGYAARPAGTYGVLASHGSGLRFARPGARLDDWRAAFAQRRLDPLLTRIAWFEIEK